LFTIYLQMILSVGLQTFGGAFEGGGCDAGRYPFRFAGKTAPLNATARRLPPSKNEWEAA
jgi:hypothetical protein